MDIERIQEMDGGFLGETCGYYCKGHVDKYKFANEATKHWLAEETEKLELGQIDEIGECPIKKSWIKHSYYREATIEDVKEGNANYVHEFIMSSFDKTLDPITYAYFDCPY